MFELICGAIYVLIALGFFIVIRTETVRQEAPFRFLEVIVAVFWPIWLAWYSFTIVRDKFSRS